MNRRGFVSGLGALGAGFFFPRKTRAVVPADLAKYIEEQGMTDEEMATFLASISACVMGDASVVRERYSGCDQNYISASLFIYSNSIVENRWSFGTRVFLRQRSINSSDTLVSCFEVADPNLSVIRLPSKKTRNFARVKGIWLEAGDNHVNNT